jgi:uncharacterized lipoprotein YddW (UPF0748 family)
VILLNVLSCFLSSEPLGEPAGAPGTHRELVEVSHRREFRGVWVATVANINFPSRTGLTPDQGRAELDHIVDAAADAGFNALMFQVRPEGDALYRSDLEPWSRYLTGTQGKDPGFDPLAYLIARAHRRDLEVHAWFNPYRAKSSRTSVAVAPHVSVTDPDLVCAYGNLLWMDPGSPKIRERTVDVVADVATRYDVDGIHFDDYFYPYPDGSEFPDARSYASYQTGGGGMSRPDWRRSNVDGLVEEVADRVRSARGWVRFGVSPFGIYRPGSPAGVSGFDQFAGLYADPMKWVKEGWVDYVAPQLYWTTTAAHQPYDPLIQWWARATGGQGNVFAGNFLAALGTKPQWTVDEFRLQLAATRMAHALGATGNIFYHIGPILTNKDGIADIFRKELYNTPALTPALTGERPEPDAPEAEVDGHRVRLAHVDPTPLRAYGVYRAESGRWTLDHLLPSTTAVADLDPGKWAISAVNRYGDESRGIVVDIE